jgi:uncharacterized protein YjeT (DUF2065 family)
LATTADLPRLADRIGRYDAFRRWLRIAMAANVVVGLTLLIIPETVRELLSLPVAASAIYLRYIGLFIVVVTVSYTPAAVFPPAARFLGLYAILVRLVFVVFFLVAGGGFLWFALFDAVFSIILVVTFLAGVRDDLAKRP